MTLSVNKQSANNVSDAVMLHTTCSTANLAEKKQEVATASIRSDETGIRLSGEVVVTTPSMGGADAAIASVTPPKEVPKWLFEGSTSARAITCNQ